MTKIGNEDWRPATTAPGAGFGPVKVSAQTLPTDSQERKDIPLATGLLDYFPAILAAVARVSKAGNDKHNPGEPLHHARGKSMDHPDCAVRHLMERGSTDPDTGEDHVALACWRMLALGQEIYEQQYGAPLARGARLPSALDEIQASAETTDGGW